MPHPSGRPWIIAHRGASLRAPENTIEAFELAAELGADAVELDVRNTRDGVLLVHHDDTIEGAETPIVAMDASDVADLGPWIPTLGEALEACRDIWVDIEIKNDPRDADWDPDHSVAEAVAEVVRTARAEVVVTSFNPDTVAAAHGHGLRTGLLVGRGLDPAELARTAARAGHEFLLPHHSTLRGEHGSHVVDAARSAGVELAVWTVDETDEIRRLARLGVGGIATNAPDVAASALDQDGHGDRGESLA